MSRVFLSQNDGKDKLAISCPVVTGAPGGPWVLAATVTTGDTFGLINLHGQRHKAVLVAPRDPSTPGKWPRQAGHVVLIHPAFAPGDAAIPFPPGAAERGPEPDGEPELRLATAAGPAPLSPDADYRDPVADHGHPEYAGRWLTGSARVGHTELVVLVQQRYDDAVAPHRSYFRRFLAWLGVAVATGLVSFLALRLTRWHRVRPGV